MRQREIDRLLGEEKNRRDHSLRGHAMHRATSGELPKTLTAHEWERWYAEHGIPAEHRCELTEAKSKSWWEKLAHYLLPKR